MHDYVLIVDDDPDVRSFMSSSIDLYGMAARNAADGQQALAMIREQPPSAIILDLLMPAMSGFSTLSHLQNDPTSRSIPVIVVSGLAAAGGDVQRLPGVVGVMRKAAFSLDDLFTMLNKAGLKGARAN